jgi:hypothetical protein
MSLVWQDPKCGTCKCNVPEDDHDGERIMWIWTWSLKIKLERAFTSKNVILKERCLEIDVSMSLRKSSAVPLAFNVSVALAHSVRHPHLRVHGVGIPCAIKIRMFLCATAPQPAVWTMANRFVIVCCSTFQLNGFSWAKHVWLTNARWAKFSVRYCLLRRLYSFARSGESILTTLVLLA